MRKIYIAPETEQLHVIKEVPLCAGTTEVTGTNENNPDGDGNDNPKDGGGGGGTDIGARQHNWMWDNLEDEY